MKTLMILASLILLTNCTGGSIAKVKFGKKCTVADANGSYEKSFIWLVDRNNKTFGQKINKENCKKNI